MFKINDQNQIGLMYRSRINLKYEGKAVVDGISPALDAVAGFSGPTQQMIFFGAGTYPTPENWHSAVSESFGTQYDLTDRFRVRTGYYHHAHVIPKPLLIPIYPTAVPTVLRQGSVTILPNT